jgi:hypothetical protein
MDSCIINGKNSNYNSKDSLVEMVYYIIKSRNGKRITTKQIEEMIGSSGGSSNQQQHKVRYAINRLIEENKIKRIRSLGVDRIEYTYQIKHNNNHNNMKIIIS